MGAVDGFDGRAYQARFDTLAERGVDVHGEATLVRSLNPGSVLDAGCGSGRVAIELARHGVEVVGVDVDASMIAEARRRAPTLSWVRADLATLALGRSFDVVLLAGNVPLFCPVADRHALVEACAAHVPDGGALVAGFQLDRAVPCGGEVEQAYGLDDYDAACSDAGLTLAERWATWDGQPFVAGGDYAVSLHRR
ncbi:MAG TPA: class I SAM-dependent methyltransferase [Acidimicrobiales bacterium]|nr:class I SAM-dependent methyltransferase [Acidimicrobiales bacterium]